MAINLCERCYVFELKSDCVISTDVVNVIMPLSGTYDFWVSDKFGNNWVYTQNTNTNVNSEEELQLPLAVFPEGFFTQFSGSYEVMITDNGITNQALTFTVDGVEYDCFIIKTNKYTQIY